MTNRAAGEALYPVGAVFDTGYPMRKVGFPHEVSSKRGLIQLIYRSKGEGDYTHRAGCETSKRRSLRTNNANGDIHTES
jgi:hypothetical protein